jgi:hypothetical protein
MSRRPPDAHVHRWRIDEPDGRAWLEGRCAACGAVRRFPASEDAWLESRGISRDRYYPAHRPAELPAQWRLRDWRDW